MAEGGSSAEGGVAGTSVLASVAENSEVSVSERKGAFMNLPPIYKLYPLTVVSPLHSQANDPVDAMEENSPMDVEHKGSSSAESGVAGTRLPEPMGTTDQNSPVSVMERT